MLKRVISIFLLSILFISFSAESNNKSSSYNFKFNPEFEHRDIRLVVITWKTQKELNDYRNEFIKKWKVQHPESPIKFEGKTVRAWSAWDKDSRGCVIHVLEIDNGSDESRWAEWGHEVLHCVYGNWH